VFADDHEKEERKKSDVISGTPVSQKLWKSHKVYPPKRSLVIQLILTVQVFRISEFYAVWAGGFP
jgi:hypothetical protein